jgi:PAS domain S-box-containing protein
MAMKPDKPSTAGPPTRDADHRQVRQIIAGLREGVLLVEPDQTIVWANQAALAMHGVATLEELGGTVGEYRKRFELRYRNNHRLPHGEYPIDRVIAGEAFDEVVVEVARAGQAEPTWVHRVRSLVLTDAEGEPDVLALVLTDETGRAEAEARFESMFGANPAPAVICRLADLRYVKVNQGFLELTGHKRDEVIGRSVYEVDVLERAERRELAVERLREGRTIPQMEACLEQPGGASKHVVVAGQPIEVGDEPCMLFTFMDLEPRKQAEDALRQSEERFVTSFRLAPVPTTLSTLDGFRFLEVNAAFTTSTGYVAEEVVGRSPAEIRLWGDAASREGLEEMVLKSGSVRNLEIQMQAKDGGLLDCLVSAETVTIHDQLCVLSVMQDITARKRSEAELFGAIEAVMKDTSWFSRTVIEKLVAIRTPGQAEKSSAGVTDLTGRERDVLALMCLGLADKQAAAALGLSLNTVRNHVAAIYRKIDVRRRTAAINWARKRGFAAEETAKAAGYRA